MMRILFLVVGWLAAYLSVIRLSLSGDGLRNFGILVVVFTLLNKLYAFVSERCK